MSISQTSRFSKPDLRDGATSVHVEFLVQEAGALLPLTSRQPHRSLRKGASATSGRSYSRKSALVRRVDKWPLKRISSTRQIALPFQFANSFKLYTISKI